MQAPLLLTFLLFGLITSSQPSIDPNQIVMAPMSDHGPASSSDPLPFTTRAHWMRRANAALSDILSPCPPYAFGTAIVNHTGTDGLGELICIGVNDNGREGNPTLHGEMSAIRNCTSVLTDMEGEYRLNGVEAIAAFRDLSLYTNGEPCPMVCLIQYSRK
jgi:tRNA(Arg) A34 adenosine deaminase TadA